MSAAAEKRPVPQDADLRARAFTHQVGDAIRFARRTREWTQAELATRAGLSSNYVARLERGELGASLWVAHRIANALGTTLDALIAAEPAAPPLVQTKFAKRYEL